METFRFGDEPLKQQCLDRIAWMFRVNTESLDPGKRFGVDLNPSIMSDFSRNEFDQIQSDILDIQHDMKRKGKEIEEIWTVWDFCKLVDEYNRVCPEDCKQLLKRWEKEMTIAKLSIWRRAIFKVFGM